MSAGFTPGPWAINPRKPVGRRVFMPDDCIEVAREDGSMVACLYAANASMDGSTDRANARLIASAPALHDALHQVLLSLIGLHIGTHEASKSAAASIDLGQAALAKARGDQ